MIVYMNLDYKLSSLNELKDKTINTMPDGSYFLTITLDPKIYKRTISEQFITVRDFIKNILKQYSDNFWLVAELTEQSNVHFHGFISFAQSHYKHHIIDALKRFPLGMSKINNSVIVEKRRTVEYMYKEYPHTTQFINKPLIRYKKKILLDGAAFGRPAEGRPFTELDRLQQLFALDFGIESDTNELI